MPLTEKQRTRCLNPHHTKPHLHWWCYTVLSGEYISATQATTCCLIAGLTPDEQWGYQVLDNVLLQIPTNVVQYERHPVNGWQVRGRPTTYKKVYIDK